MVSFTEVKTEYKQELDYAAWPGRRALSHPV